TSKSRQSVYKSIDEPRSHSDIMYTCAKGCILWANSRRNLMSADQSSSKKPRSTADRLERQLDKVKAHERKKFLNENILRLEKNGDLSYQAVRTYALPAREGEAPAEPHKPEAQARGPAADQLSDFHGEHHTDVSENPAISNLLPNKLPESPALQENGNLIPG